MRFRQSVIGTWMRCSLQAYYKEIEGLPGVQGSKAAFGTVMHAALEHMIRTGNADEAVKLFISLWDDPVQIGCEIQEWNKFSTFGGLRQRGVEIIRAMEEAERWDNRADRTVLATEHKFLVPFGRHELTGTVDLIDVRKNHKGKQIVRIVDYKSNSRRPNLSELLLNTQFTTYIYASLQPEFWLGNGPDFLPIVNGEWWWEMLKDTPRRGVWVQLWDNGKEIDAGDRDEDDFGRLYTVCEQIERAITLDVYVPSIGEHCGFCDFRNGPCPTKVPSREGWAASRLEDENAWL